MLRIYIKLVKGLRIIDELDLCNFIAFLLWNWYFNLYKKEMYSIQSYKSNILTLPITKGFGCCINFTILLTDFLNKLNIKAGLAISFLDKVDINSRTMDINRVVKNYFIII